MGTKKDNLVKSQNNGGQQDKDDNKRRSHTQNNFNQPLASVEDSMQSAEDVDYNQILPAVKVRPKRKKRSPSSTLNDEKNDSIGGPGAR